MEQVLIVNAGSSSLKWALYSRAQLGLLASGIAERIGQEGSSIHARIVGQDDIHISLLLPDHEAAVAALLKL